MDGVEIKSGDHLIWSIETCGVLPMILSTMIVIIAITISTIKHIINRSV